MERNAPWQIDDQCASKLGLGKPQEVTRAIESATLRSWSHDGIVLWLKLLTGFVEGRAGHFGSAFVCASTPMSSNLEITLHGRTRCPEISHLNSALEDMDVVKPAGHFAEISSFLEKTVHTVSMPSQEFDDGHNHPRL